MLSPTKAHAVGSWPQVPDGPNPTKNDGGLIYRHPLIRANPDKYSEPVSNNGENNMDDMDNKWMAKWLMATVFSLGLYTTQGMQKAWTTVLNTPGAVWATATEHTEHGVLGLGPGTQVVPVGMAYPNADGTWTVHGFDEEGDRHEYVYRNVTKDRAADYLMQAARDTVRYTDEWYTDVVRYNVPEGADEYPTY